MKYLDALKIAERVKSECSPFCDRIEIAGSVRRHKEEVGDIELVAIRSEVPLFHEGIEQVLDKYIKIKGDAALGKYCQRELPEGINLDVFFCSKENWGLIFLIRTGSADFSKWMVGKILPLQGYLSRDGRLLHRGKVVDIPEEEDLFRLAKMEYITPAKRI